MKSAKTSTGRREKSCSDKNVVASIEFVLRAELHEPAGRILSIPLPEELLPNRKPVEKRRPVIFKPHSFSSAKRWTMASAKKDSEMASRATSQNTSFRPGNGPSERRDTKRVRNGRPRSTDHRLHSDPSGVSGTRDRRVRHSPYDRHFWYAVRVGCMQALAAAVHSFHRERSKSIKTTCAPGRKRRGGHSEAKILLVTPRLLADPQHRNLCGEPIPKASEGIFSKPRKKPPITLVAHGRFIRLERCPVTDFRHSIDRVSAVSSQSIRFGSPTLSHAELAFSLDLERLLVTQEAARVESRRSRHSICFVLDKCPPGIEHWHGASPNSSFCLHCGYADSKRKNCLVETCHRRRIQRHEVKGVRDFETSGSVRHNSNTRVGIVCLNMTFRSQRSSLQLFKPDPDVLTAVSSSRTTVFTVWTMDFQERQQLATQPSQVFSLVSQRRDLKKLVRTIGVGQTENCSKVISSPGTVMFD